MISTRAIGWLLVCLLLLLMVGSGLWYSVLWFYSTAANSEELQSLRNPAYVSLGIFTASALGFIIAVFWNLKASIRSRLGK
ncbi:hypothetical protein OAH36_04045 [Verrucomicrobia bacterium]|jgi:hypothetical protein|nr:hypothetical protein [Verrucomicrobiota bacterium]MDA7510939.1 hypothetical protein [Verrucomicrobiota bacterium]MDB4798750.1 hypothetical protein [Verrucomicrobiota bacterium]